MTACLLSAVGFVFFAAGHDQVWAIAVGAGIPDFIETLGTDIAPIARDLVTQRRRERVVTGAVGPR